MQSININKEIHSQETVIIVEAAARTENLMNQKVQTIIRKINKHVLTLKTNQYRKYTN